MWHGGWPWFWGFGWLFGLILFFTVSRLLWWRSGYGCGGWYGPDWHGRPGYPGGPGQAEAILRERLARGEIDQAEYDRLRDVLRT